MRLHGLVGLESSPIIRLHDLVGLEERLRHRDAVLELSRILLDHLIPPLQVALQHHRDGGAEDGGIDDDIIFDRPISAFAQFDSDAEAKVLVDMVVG